MIMGKMQNNHLSSKNDITYQMNLCISKSKEELEFQEINLSKISFIKTINNLKFKKKKKKQRNNLQEKIYIAELILVCT